MTDEDLKLLMDWFEKNKDHKLNIIEKGAIKLAVNKAATVGDLLKTALDLLKELGRYLRHHDASTGRLQALGVILDTEDAHLTIRTTIGLQSLESLLSVMQTGCSHVQFQILVGAYLDFAPLTVLVVTTYVVVCWHVAK